MITLALLNSFPSYDEQQLLRELSKGSEAAFTELFRTYRDKLFSYAYKLSGSQETAEDLVHDLFLKVWLQRQKFSEVKNLNAWLYMVAKNQFLDVFRRKAKENLILAELQKDQTGEAAFEGEINISQQEVLASIHKALSKLSPQQKEIFVLSRQKKLKTKEIAALLGLAERSVLNQLSLALGTLREELGHTYGSFAIILFVLHQLQP